MTVTGYVNVTARDSRTLHDAGGPFVEQIMPGAFGRALKSGNSVELRFDHERVLGSTATGEIQLREDAVGLKAEAVIRDPDVIGAAERRELRGWSFGFVKQADRWKTDESGTRRRFVDELELREVSILDKTPAYIATSIETRDDAEIMVEYRVLDEDPEVETEAVPEAEKEKETRSEPTGEIDRFIARKRLEIAKLK